MIFYKYQGAGNDFLIADNRDGHLSEIDGVLYAKNVDGSQWSRSIEDICDRRYGVGADGVMLLEDSDRYDFNMAYYNSDGSGGMMCGNGGRCIVAFAADRGIGHFDFDAADGFHKAHIIKDEHGVKTVQLKMKDVSGLDRYDRLSGVNVPSAGYFLDTGTRHYVRFVEGLDSYDIVNEGRVIRTKGRELEPIGANVNYVEPVGEGVIKVRTYEKGVEDETFACGTGIVASAMASYVHGVRPIISEGEDGHIHAMYTVYAKRDILAVSFNVVPGEIWSAADVWLTGPAAFVAEINI
jgi:diaminopimelate epimerase